MLRKMGLSQQRHRATRSLRASVPLCLRERFARLDVGGDGAMDCSGFAGCDVPNDAPPTISPWRSRCGCGTPSQSRSCSSPPCSPPRRPGRSAPRARSGRSRAADGWSAPTAWPWTGSSSERCAPAVRSCSTRPHRGRGRAGDGGRGRGFVHRPVPPPAAERPLRRRAARRGPQAAAGAEGEELIRIDPLMTDSRNTSGCATRSRSRESRRPGRQRRGSADTRGARR